MRQYEVVNKKTDEVIFTTEAKTGNAALREYGCNVPVGGLSTYKTPKGRVLRARPVKA